eukprot:241583-Prorocentrum_lima.AAC.1
MVPKVLPFLNQEPAKVQERGAARRHHIFEVKTISNMSALFSSTVSTGREGFLRHPPATTLLACHGSGGL